jgi:arylsulfatase A-like enzyme
MPARLERESEYTRYIAGIERADVLFGRLWSELEARRLLDDTLVVVVGDHGEGHGRAPRRWDVSHSGQVFEDDVHVPLLFLHPALRGESSELVTHTDLLPTLVDLLALPPLAGLDGRSLLRPVPARPLYLRSVVWWPLAIRAGRYKLLLPEAAGPPALYDLETDPIEAVDQGQAQPEVRRALAAELLRWHAERFRSDPSFGARFLRLERVWNGPMRSLDWARPTPKPPPP